jgi:hypothetical protein
MKYLVVVVVAFLISACGGYKPVPQYSNDIFEQPVLTKVKMDPEDPESGVFLQDEIAKMAVNRLNLTLTKNVDKAKCYILVNSYTVNTTPINKDDDGNVIRYSVNAAIEFAIKDKFGFWSKNIVASEYVSVKAQSLVSTFDKEKAGKVAIKKALDTFILAVMQRSRKVGENKKEMESVKANTQEEITSDTDSLEPLSTNTAEQTSEPATQTTSVGINIVPTEDNTLIQDATQYN